MYKGATGPLYFMQKNIDKGKVKFYNVICGKFDLKG